MSPSETDPRHGESKAAQHPSERRSRVRSFSIVGGSVLLLACAASTAVSVGTPDTAPPSVPGLAAASAAPLDSAPSDQVAKQPLDLQEFSPLLVSPALAEAREAEDDGRYADALRLVQAHVDAVHPTGRTAFSFSFLLGRLAEAAEQPELAVRYYEAAASSPWELGGYAKLRAARNHLALGAPKPAARHLDELMTSWDGGTSGAENRSGEPPRLLLEAALGLRADTAELLEDLDRAIALRRRSLELGGSQGDPLKMAELLLRRLDERTTAGEKVQSGAATKPTAVVAPTGAKQGSSGEGFSVSYEALEAFRWAERAQIGLEPSSTEAREARKLARLAHARIDASLRPKLDVRSEDAELSHIEGLLDRGDYDDALEAADALRDRLATPVGETGCELSYLRSKVLAAKREWGRAADGLTDAVEHCRHDADLRARILYLAGKYSAADGRDSRAVRYYEMLENEAQGHRLADDGRLRRAQSYLRMGVEARFTELLSTMPEDYPEGDMTMDGVLELALRRIEKADWSGASSVLERGVAALGGADVARGHEYSGRERYFLARARYELGEKKQAIDEYAAIVRELPLSYYMLHAYSRLRALDEKLAEASLEEGLRRASQEPFSFAHRPEFERPEFRRALELFRVGDISAGRAELSLLGLGAEADASLLWGVALLYGRAGSARYAHGIARAWLTDWLSAWPEGDWEAPWEIAFPRPYASIVTRESKKNGVPEWMIYGVMREESAFDPSAESPANAYGLMQLIVPTAKIFARKEGLPYRPAALKRPAINIALGSRALASLHRRFSDNPVLAIPGYNAGPGRPARWLRQRPHVDFDVWVELIPFRETRRYTKRVLASRAAYAFLYHREHAEQALRLPLRLEPPE